MRNHASLYMYADEATSICKDVISPLLHPLPAPCKNACQCGADAMSLVKSLHLSSMKQLKRF